MPTQPPTVPSQPTDDSKVRSILIFSAIGLFAAIVFGLLYLFVIAPSVPNGSLGWYLFSFATGLTMIVMPCTLPLAFVIVPLSMGKGVLRGLGMALAFGVGVAFTLSTYGIVAALLGGVALDFLGNDIEGLKNWVYFFAGTFAFVFALSEIGLLNIHMPTYSGAAPAFIQKRGEVIKAFLLGAFLGNVGVGCPHPATPLILIEIATSGDVLYGWTMFLTHAIGRVLPLLLLAFLAVLGVNGLNWLMSRKATVERVTGWGMVFVAGFILTLGLFSHDWWVNSGLHSGLEAITQEAYFNEVLNTNFGTAVEHVHGLETGVGLFGQPLQWGHWFLVIVWLIPIWWWYLKKRRRMNESPAFALARIEREMDKLEQERNNIETTANIDQLDPETDLAALITRLKELKKLRREAAKKVDYGETGIYKNEVARQYEVKILGMQRNYLIGLSVVLALVFIYFLPTNFFLKSTNPAADTHGHGATTDTSGYMAMPDGTVMDHHGATVPGAHVMPDGTIMLADGSTVGKTKLSATPFSNDPTGLPYANEPDTVVLQDGDSYDITAYYVQKEVGNRMLRMLAYNGSVPGPFIKAPQGAEVTINFTNNSDLDQTIHSHGVRLDNNSDGVPGVTQNVVKPGESYTYTLSFEDGGVYWYHPHTRDDYGQEMGLYGNYLVDPTSGYPSSVNREVPLVIDDILIENGRIAEFYQEVTNFALLGRFGNEFLVNGEQNYTLTAKSGEVMRFFVTNVSNARTYNLSLPGAQMKLVGADVGQYERETIASDFLISPAERMIVEAYFPKAGVYQLLHTMPSGKVELVRFVVTDEPVTISHKDDFQSLKTNSEVVDEFASFRSYISKSPDKSLLLTVQLDAQIDHSAHMHTSTADSTGGVDHSQHTHMSGTGDRLASVQWEDPAQSDYTNTTDTVIWKMIDQATGRESMDIPVSDWTFKQGSLVKIRLTNDATADHVMQHPIHLHGQRFVVLSENGVPNNNMAWKDTVLVFPGETVDILVDMSNLGEWMSHCHISEHLHAGMMLQFRVEDDNGYATGDEFRATVPAGSGHTTPSKTDQNRQAVSTDTYLYEDMTRVETDYLIETSPSMMQAEREGLIEFSFYDLEGNPLSLDPAVDRALTVNFVSSDNNIRFTTYPGNTTFPAASDFNIPGEEGFDESMPHSHSLLSIPVAYAHGGEDDGHTGAGSARTYSVPVKFPSKGLYRGFVEFKLPDDPTTHIGVVNIEVSSGSFSVDNFGWSPTMKWWILLIISLLLMVPLVIGVKRYINVDKV